MTFFFTINYPNVGICPNICSASDIEGLRMVTAFVEVGTIFKCVDSKRLFMIEMNGHVEQHYYTIWITWDLYHK